MLIDINDLFYLYEKDGEKIVALRGMHLQIRSGECLVIKGPNGSGKSTLVKILSGFLTPSAGHVLVDKNDISAMDALELRRECVATIDQKGNLLPDLNVEENMVLAFTLTGLSRAESLVKVSELLSRHGLSSIQKAEPAQLSAGERQLCAVLTALARNPKVLIADEPSGELDNDAAKKVYELLKDVSGATTVVLVTHDARAELYADRIVRVRDGRISAEWISNGVESPVIDPFGWMQVAEPEPLHFNAQVNSFAVDKGAPVLSLNSISLRYGERELFNELSCEAHSREFIVITGPSASGKSSLLRIMAGMQEPSSGEVQIDSQRISDLNRDERALLRQMTLSFLAQGDNPVERLSVLDYFGDEDIEPLAFLDDYRTRLNRHLSRFSGGERARLEIHKALSLKRKLIIFDEPTSQLDDKQSARIAELIVEYVNTGGTAIVSTRDELILTLATRIIALS